MRLTKTLLVCAVVSLLAACGPSGNTLCQSGPKYGTQCHALPNDPAAPPQNMSAPPPQEPRSVLPK